MTATSITELRQQLNWMTTTVYIYYKLLIILKKTPSYGQQHTLQQSFNILSNTRQLRSSDLTIRMLLHTLPY